MLLNKKKKKGCVFLKLSELILSICSRNQKKTRAGYFKLQTWEVGDEREGNK
jgi:hypothetical protein